MSLPRSCGSTAERAARALSGAACLAVMSIASFARYRFVPIPAVAVMPVVYNTSRIMVMARSWADIL